MITKDTIGTGNPDKRFTASAGKTYLDVQSGIRYAQTTSPSGNNWIEFENDQFFYPSDYEIATTGNAPDSISQFLLMGG